MYRIDCNVYPDWTGVVDAGVDGVIAFDDADSAVDSKNDGVIGELFLNFAVRDGDADLERGGVAVVVVDDGVIVSDFGIRTFRFCGIVIPGLGCSVVTYPSVSDSVNGRY